MKFSAALILGASLAAISPAVAQNAPGRAAIDTPTPVAGATIYDPQGLVVGTVATVSDQVVIVDTGANQVALPPDAIGYNEKGLLVSVTKADLDAAAEKQRADAQAQLAALLVAGTAVNSSDGQLVGTVKEVGPEYVTVTTQGVEVKLPKNAFALNQAGALQIAMTAANFAAAVSGSGAAPAPASDAAATDAAADAAADAGADAATDAAADAATDTGADAAADANADATAGE